MTESELSEWRQYQLDYPLPPPALFIELFNACFRIQREASEAAGRHIPMVVENVRGAQKWVGRAQWHYGSFYLWGDVPALMPQVIRAQKFNSDGTAHGQGSWFAIADSKNRGSKNTGGSWFNIAHNTTSGKGQNPDGRKTRDHPNIRDGHTHTRHLTNPDEHRSECDKRDQIGVSRKFASAMIAKIPLPLSRHIAAVYRGETRS
jgi:hypothetical protein